MTVYSVKHWDSSIGSWCHGYMTTDRELARVRHDAIRKGIWYGVHTTRAKIVIPKQWVIDGYVAAGNDIDSREDRRERQFRMLRV